MYESKYKIVEFEKYCPSCKYLNEPEDEEPCNECLTEASNLDSHKPINYKEDEE